MIKRLQFDLDDLATEMLDALPEYVFISKTTTFLDPSMGGGQFVSAIENRLREYGHSDSNIAGRVYGFEHSWRVQIAVNRHNLLGNYEIADFIEDDVLMKFDVIIGNPPFQTTTASDGNRQGGFWFEFIKKAAEVLKPKGTMAFVSPRWTGIGWQGTKAYKLDWFKQFHMTHINFDAKEYFPNTGSSFVWYVLRKDSKGTTKVMNWDGELDLNKIDVLPFHVSKENISILKKMLKANNGETYNFTEDSRTRVNEGKRKVYIINGRFIEAKYIKIDATGDTEDNWKASMPLKCKEVVGARSVFTSKLAHHMWNIMGGPDGLSQTGILLKCMPIVDLTEKWTDEELYDHIGLTNKEREYVESNVG